MTSRARAVVVAGLLVSSSLVGIAVHDLRCNTRSYALCERSNGSLARPVPRLHR